MISVEGLKKYTANSKWVGENYEQLKKKYPDEWIAVLHESVVGHGKDYHALIATLRVKYADDYDRISVKYVSIGEEHFVLGCK